MLFTVLGLSVLLEAVAACVPTHHSALHAHLHGRGVHPHGANVPSCRRCRSADVLLDRYPNEADNERAVNSKSGVRQNANNCNVMTLICTDSQNDDIGTMSIEIDRQYLLPPAEGTTARADVVCTNDGQWVLDDSVLLGPLPVSSFRCVLQTFVLVPGPIIV